MTNHMTPERLIHKHLDPFTSPEPETDVAIASLVSDLEALLTEAKINENVYWGEAEGGTNWRQKEMCKPYVDRIAELKKEASNE